MNYKDYEYEQFMKNVADGHYQVLEVSLREWETVSTRRTLKCTDRDNMGDYAETEYLYQVRVKIAGNNGSWVMSEFIEFDDDQEQAEKVYEELMKWRASTNNK